MSPSRRRSRRCRRARARATAYGRMEAARRLADPHHARSRRLHRGADQRLPRDRERRRASPISSIAAGRPAFCACSTTGRSALPISPATGSTSRQGNLAENPKAHLFLIDYAHRRRVKIWGEARVVEGDAGADREADAAGLQGAAGAGDPLHRRGLGRELPAAHPAALRGCAGRRDGGASATSASRRWRRK